jgi:hypothetical protein
MSAPGTDRSGSAYAPPAAVVTATGLPRQAIRTVQHPDPAQNSRPNNSRVTMSRRATDQALPTTLGFFPP